MSSRESEPASVRSVGSSAARLGCVSYLNAKPLIEGLDDEKPSRVRFDVPARLLADLEAGEVDLALCPVIDYHRAALPLMIVPVGAICCEGPTLTVRLFSKVPIAQVRTVHADSDSHTSVALMQVLLDAKHNLRPRVIDYHAREHVADHRLSEPPETMLLIGDKVVTDSPLAVTYPHQLDLGEAWHELTGLPFVFAVWMARADTALGELPALLNNARQRNAQRIDAIVQRYATKHGWPTDLAKQYLGHILRYEVGPRELAAIERFGHMAAQRGLIEQYRPLRVWSGGDSEGIQPQMNADERE